MNGLWPVAACLLLAGCQPPAPVATPRYVPGTAWQAEGVWHYPQDSLELDATGIAAIYRAPPRLTTDGEVYDATALTAAQPTLALPAIARLTNLGNGLQIRVRINDRGPADPGRLVVVTPRVASLLQFGPDGLARVRLEVLPDESRAVAGALPGGSGPRLDVGLAPVAAVRQSDLAPPDGARRRAGQRAAVPNAAPASAPGAAHAAPASAPGAAHAAPTSAPGAAHAAPTSAPGAPAMAQLLAGTVGRVPADPGRILIGAGSFGRREFADLRRMRLAGMAARIERVQTGRAVSFRVMLGPYSTVEGADSALRQAIAAGVTDASIVVE